MDIKELRQQIDQIDDKLVQIFNERMNVAAQIAEVKRENAKLSHTYHTSYDLEEIRQQAEKQGMVDAEKADCFTVFFDLPKEVKKPSAWDDFVWLLSGLFSEPRRNCVS